MIKHFSRNLEGKDYVVGDIHGSFTKLDCELYTLGFNRDTDRLFSVGDLVDRGSESEKVLGWLAEPWFHSVRGNHCQMIINAYREPDVRNNAYFSYMNGGMWFVDHIPDSKKERYVKAFEALPFLIEVETDNGLVGVVHAEVPNGDWETAKRDLATGDKHSIEASLWARTKVSKGYTKSVTGVVKVYSGHTPLDDVKILGNQYFIDTGAVFTGGKLTILEI